MKEVELEFGRDGDGLARGDDRCAANDLTKRLSMSDEKIRNVLNELSPDSSRHDIIVRWLHSPNP